MLTKSVKKEQQEELITYEGNLRKIAALEMENAIYECWQKLFDFEHFSFSPF